MNNLVKTFLVFKSAFNDLTPREQKILSLRLGLSFTETKTLEEVGKEFGVTRERVRQIEAKALSLISIKLKEIQNDKTTTL